MTKCSQCEAENAIMNITAENVDHLLEKEWLLTNERGSYSSSTIIGCNTRRYHGLLVSSLRPPVERIVTLADLLETVRMGKQSYELANFEFSDRLHPRGYRYLKRFWQDEGVHFLYEIENLQVEKSIYLCHDQDLLVITYDFSGEGEGQFSLMPLVTLRDFHSLQSSSTSLTMEEDGDVYTAHVLDPHGPAVHFYCPEASFHWGADWWYAMHYRLETRRGQSDYEDVWACGAYQAEFKCPMRITLLVQATAGLQRPGPLDTDVDEIIRKLKDRREELVCRADAKDDDERQLAQAADQFIVRRRIDESRQSASIMAGYHWFADWGRDTFISLPGLLLATGRYSEAYEVLMTFGSVLSRGQIPNRFDDYGGPPHYNSVDASLWYINAAYQYLLVTGDEQVFQKHFRPVIKQIVECYHRGTRDNIHADEDGLLSAGDVNTQLTWMDARCNGVSFTPRYGKAVEINALWYNALRILAETGVTDKERQDNHQRCRQVESSFSPVFWNQVERCLYDCILPDGTADASIRPNQIFAVSLPFSCLDLDQQKSVVSAVRQHLLTPYGLRSLSNTDRHYQGHYEGDQFQRDSAYHQGTVWAFLTGPFIEAFLKVNEYSDAAKRMAGEMISPLLHHLHEQGCLGSVSEIFDGDPPYYHRGCIAQAWSVAELLRCKKMINDPSPI
ncbi:MAG: glycogen debranching enzyme family protein [Sedimentisphaerales bacterium]|nr:glycogen debranching enzyme family protein [Sedimentisphaerales bacterium]